MEKKANLSPAFSFLLCNQHIGSLGPLLFTDGDPEANKSVKVTHVCYGVARKFGGSKLRMLWLNWFWG